MKKIIILALLAACTLPSLACTNLIVGKKASKDGSVMVSYSADSYGMFIGLYHFAAGKHAPGEMRQIYDWDTNRYWGEIPEAPETYNVVGNMNEWQVSIGETTYGGREEMADSTGIIDYGSLIYIALQRSKTAREAIRVMTRLVETHGYNSEGETFSICDPNEAWIMELMGKGPGSKGVVWVAQRIPDDCIAAHANQSRIRQFPQTKKFNKKQNWYEIPGECIYSADCIKYARKQGWFSGKDSDFSWADAYAPADFGGRRYCDARVWSFFNRWAEGGFEEYLPWALGKDKDAKPMPLWIKPKQKLGVADMEMSMRDHYEGTALDMTADVSAGPWASPYRNQPVTFKSSDGTDMFRERPIGCQQSGMTMVCQMRSWLPDYVGCCLWFGNDDPNMVALTPVYCCTKEAPIPYNEKTADTFNFSFKSAFWLCNWVSNMVYYRYNQLFPELQAVRDRLEKDYNNLQKDVETRVAGMSEAEARQYLSDYSHRMAGGMTDEWMQLAQRLIVKYNDMAVKAVDEEGRYKKTPGGVQVPVVRPGYPEAYRRQIVKQAGERYRTPGQ